MDNLFKAQKIYHAVDAVTPFIVERYVRNKQKQLCADMHYNFQIVIVLNGIEEFVLPDFRTVLYRGQLCWTSCWEPHACRSLHAKTIMVPITLSPEYLGNASTFQDVNWLAPFLAPPAERPQARSRPARGDVLGAAAEIWRLEQRRPKGWRTLQWLKIHELIAKLIAGWGYTQSASQTQMRHQLLTRILPAIALIKNSKHKLPSLTDAAHLCGFGRSQFSTLFSQATGISFGQFAIRARISEAARLLRTTPLPVKAVAYQCGFKDISHFYHVFRRHFQYPPAECRQAAQSFVHINSDQLSTLKIRLPAP